MVDDIEIVEADRPEDEIAAPVVSEETAASTAAPESKATEGEKAPPSPAPEPDWKMARITKQSDRIKALQVELEKYKATAEAPANTVPVSELERLANERATALAAQQTFNARCDEVAAQGQRQFSDFDAKVHNLVQLQDQSDPESVRAYRTLLEAVIETGQGPELIHRLGSAPNEAARLLAMPPVKMAVALAKMTQTPQAQASTAPKPITPLTGRGSSHEAIDPADPERADRLSTRAWMERRNAEVAKRNSAA